MYQEISGCAVTGCTVKAEQKEIRVAIDGPSGAYDDPEQT